MAHKVVLLLAMNLDYELNYLIPRMQTYSLTENFETDWKFITLQIGSNDQCASCIGALVANGIAEAYGQYIETAIERIKANIPRTVVNLRKVLFTEEGGDLR